jgi:hypothetical protein
VWCRPTAPVRGWQPGSDQLNNGAREHRGRRGALRSWPNGQTAGVATYDVPNGSRRAKRAACVIGFINTFDSQSYDTNDSHRKYMPVHSTKKNGYKCVCTLPSSTPVENLGVPGLHCLPRWRRRVHHRRQRSRCPRRRRHHRLRCLHRHLRRLQRFDHFLSEVSVMPYPVDPTVPDRPHTAHGRSQSFRWGQICCLLIDPARRHSSAAWTVRCVEQGESHWEPLRSFCCCVQVSINTCTRISRKWQKA